MNEPWQTVNITCECKAKLQVAETIITTFPRNVVHTCPKCQRRHRIEQGKFVPEKVERKRTAN